MTLTSESSGSTVASATAASRTASAPTTGVDRPVFRPTSSSRSTQRTSSIHVMLRERSVKTFLRTRVDSESHETGCFGRFLWPQAVGVSTDDLQRLRTVRQRREDGAFRLRLL